METSHRGRVTRLLQFWFLSREPVGRRAYALTGFGLAPLKMAGDWALLEMVFDETWHPSTYIGLSPLFEIAALASGAVPWIALGIWTLPFLWVAVWMTFRRAGNAGFPALLVLLFFLPMASQFLIVALLLAPSVARPPTHPVVSRGPAASGRAIDLLLASLAGGAVGVAVGAGVTNIGGIYFTSVFLGAPFLIGFVAAVVFNWRARRGAGLSHAVAQLAVTVSFAVLVLLGVEGAVCLLMALPISAPLAALGAALGMACRLRPTRSVAAMALVLPSLIVTEGATKPPLPPRAVTSSLEVDAPPERVWPNVVAFTELPPPRRWIFAFGIAHPLRAHYEGHGVGAVRYCEFSTGPFVEPITTWDEPYRLAFDVTAQPPTMEEWSPYADLQPLHVTRSLRSQRGEFRLVPLPGGRTRLEGTTWYTLEMSPQVYWTLWSDVLIQAIHARVLEHIRDVTESEATGDA